jgi:large subunit ribosomal protein L19
MPHSLPQIIKKINPFCSSVSRRNLVKMLTPLKLALKLAEMLQYDSNMISVTYKDNPLHIGDTIRVKNTIVEGSKTRIQTYEGILISLRGRGENASMTVRRIGPLGIGVERIWPLDAKSIVDIEVVRKPKKVRRAKLYYLREITGRMATRV